MKYTLLTFSSILFLAVTFTNSFSQALWTKDAGPVLSGGEAGSWNRHVFMPSVLYNGDSARFEMWFGASVGQTADNWRPYRIGFATSLNGIDWDMHPTAVLTPTNDAWDESTVEGPRVMRQENGTYKMWYTGWSPDNEDGGIGYATSNDGINWEKHDTLVYAGIAHLDLRGASYCSVILDTLTNTYKMWFSGSNADYSEWNIGLATSTDGIVWQANDLDNPVLTHGSTNQWDENGIIEPSVLLHDSIFYMWFSGANNSDLRQVGQANSWDGIEWYKYNNPVLSPSSAQWDGSLIEAGTVLLINDTLHIWYSGSRNPQSTYLWRIGHATMPADSLVPVDSIVISLKKYEISKIPEIYTLKQNYPNPFNPSTNIEFSIPKSEFVTLKVYNMLGQEVVTLVSETLHMGSYNYSWDAGELASGVYLYKLQAGDFVETRKMVFLK